LISNKVCINNEKQLRAIFLGGNFIEVKKKNRLNLAKNPKASPQIHFIQSTPGS